MFSIGGGLMYILTMHGLKASEQSSISLLLVLTQFLVAAVLSGVHYDARAEYTSGIMVMEGGPGSTLYNPCSGTFSFPPTLTSLRLLVCRWKSSLSVS